MIARIGGLVLGAMLLAVPVYSTTAVDNYKKYLNEAHALMDQEYYIAAAAKFVLAATQDVKLIWKASALNNAGQMLRLAGKTSAEVNDLLDQALAVLIAKDPTDKTAILIKARIQRVKDKL